ncbi:MAG: hypothetical protein WC627_05195 [Legionella sp.]
MMGFKGVFLGLAGCVLCNSSVIAGGMGAETYDPYRMVGAVLGGYASVSAGISQSWTGHEEGSFIYSDTQKSNNAGFLGGFLGFEHDLIYPGYIIQLGAEYDYFSNATISGANYVGADWTSFTLYDYSYQFQTQQVLALAKLLGTTHQIYHPYIAVGLGAAFNQLNNFSAVTQESDPQNLAASFGDKTTTSFSFSLGLGLEADLYKNLRVGLGYRFSSFGAAGLGAGTVAACSSYSSETPFTLSVPNAFANQVLVQISYVA